MRIAKYRNIKTVVDGIKFDSKKEAKRYGELKIMQKARLIEYLRLQVPYSFKVNQILICKYVADFEYMVKGKLIVEDVKGFRTREYQIKKKLMLAIHGIEIKEV